jgi:hypothetical protein
MNPRAVGALILGLALLAAAVVPNLFAKVIAGAPTAESIPGPPSVGECVLNPVKDATTGSSEGIYSAAVLTYGPCNGPHYGEVVRVIDQGSVNLAGSWLANTVSDLCGDAAIDYLGIPADEATASTSATDTWLPTLHDGGTAGIPTDHQRAAGQQWLACTLLPQPTSATVNGYRGQVHDALRSGRVPDGIGLCGNDPVAESTKALPCDQSHQFQILGEASTTTGSSVADLTASCRQLVKTLTKMPDITANGKLLPTVTFMTWASSAGIMLSSSPMPTSDQQSATCAVRTTGSSRLTGSLLGIGSGPVPLRD